MNLLEVGNLTESEARKYLEKIRWSDGEPICPHCGVAEGCFPLQGKTTRDGLYKCGTCRRQFTVTVGTVMQGSHLTCKQWVTAFHMMCASKKGVSALQLQRQLGMGSYESAWFLCHRIRAAMEEMGLISGTVEVDETYVGGKNQPGSKPGRGTKKTPLLAIVGRKKGIHTRSLERVNAQTLKGAIRELVTPDSTIMTDELRAYSGIGKEFDGGHHTVKHGRKQFSRRGKRADNIHVNTTESYFALLKRGVHGTFHHVSKKHLDRYCNEFNFRWERRKIKDGERARSAVASTSGKRLTYKQLVNKD